MAKTRNPKNWVTGKEAAEQLGCTVKHLGHLKDQGILKGGIHWINLNPHASRPSYRWNLPKIEALLKERS